jgi:hypothetical protein
MKTSHVNENEMQEQRKDERAKWGNPARVRFLNHFFDGTLADQFKAINQDPHVNKGDIRTLPRDLLERVIQSGGQVERVE